MKKYALALLALLLLLPAVLASGEALDVAVPEYVRPYAPAEITVTCPDEGELTLRVSDDYVSYVIATAQAQAVPTASTPPMIAIVRFARFT